MYRGTVALRHDLLGPPDNVTVLALTGWDDSFVVQGIQPLPTPPPSGPLPPIRRLDAVTDTGTRHEGHGSGGHGHPRFLWHATFVPELPLGTRSLTLSGSRESAAFTSAVEFPAWPPETHDVPSQLVTADRPDSAHPYPDRPGEPLPDRVMALNVDLGVVADVRRVLTTLYCWPGWFLLTVEATGAVVERLPPGSTTAPWELRDDRGTHYVGRWIGGWGNGDSGAHVAFNPGLDPNARRLQLSFTDPFTDSGQFTTTIPVPRT
jgi:hypothetical protein